MNVKPTGDRVLIRRDEAEGRTKGGLYLPDQAKQKPRVGTVVAVGPGRRPSEAEVAHGAALVNGRMPVQYRPGQKVVFNIYGQHELPDGLDEARQLILVREEDILGVIEE